MTTNTLLTRWLTLRGPMVMDAEDGAGGGQDTGGDTGNTDANSGQGGGEAETANDTKAVLGGGTAKSDGNTPDDGASDNPPADEKSEGDKSGEGQSDDDAGADTDDVVPEDGYDFSGLDLPEGMELDSELAEGLGDTMRELGLTQSQANQLAEAYAGVLQQRADRAVEEHVERVEQWRNDATKDKELGENWDQTVDVANKALDQFGTPELKEFLSADQTGLGNHPELIRAFYRVGQAIGSDRFDRGDETEASEVPPEERWYADTTPKSKQG